MSTDYKTDVIAWANEQAELLRAGKLSEIDIENIAEEILSVGKSEQRELESRLTILLMHLLKWILQPGLRSRSWQLTIKEQRNRIKRHLKEAPSLKNKLTDNEWLKDVWADTFIITFKETGLDIIPEICPWTIEQILAEGWLPE